MDMFDKYKEFKNKLSKIKIVGGILTFAFPILLIFILIVAIVSPVTLFLDKTASIYNPDGTINSNKKTFESVILEKEEKFKEKGVIIDKELILSVLLYGNGYDVLEDYDIPEGCDLDNPDTCLTEDVVGKKNVNLSKNAAKLAEGMVKEVTIYFCQDKYVTSKRVCADDTVSFHSSFQSIVPILNLMPNLPTDGGDSLGGCKNMTTVEEVTYGEKKYCGEDNSSLCNDVCKSGYKSSHEVIYRLKDKDEFIDFLKNDYNLYEKLVDAGMGEASGEAREKMVDQAIEEIYDIYDVVKSTYDESSGIFPSLTYTSGSFNGTIYAWNQCSNELKKAIIPYTHRSYCEGGCGLAATASIISSLGGSEVNPIAIAKSYCTSNLCTNSGTYGFDIAVRAANEHGFSYSANFSGDNQEMMQEMVEKLAAGNSLVMVRVGPGTISSGTHFLVLTGVNKDGTVTMADSGRPSNNNQSWTLKEVAANAKPYGFKIFSR